jgi:hypothetical protein
MAGQQLEGDNYCSRVHIQKNNVLPVVFHIEKANKENKRAEPNNENNWPYPSWKIGTFFHYLKNENN